MGFWTKLLGLGTAALAAAAAVKVAQKYEENKAQQAEDVFDAEGAEVPHEETPGGWEDAAAAAEPDGAGRADDGDAPQDVWDDVTRAAGDVWDETREKMEDAAEKAGVDTDEVAAALREAGSALAGAGKAVATAGAAVARKVVAEAPGFLDKVKTQATDLAAQVKDVVKGAMADDYMADEGDEDEDVPEDPETPAAPEDADEPARPQAGADPEAAPGDQAQ